MNLYELVKGGTSANVIDVLRRVAIGAGNLPGQSAGRSAEELLNVYFSWTEEAERQLGNVFPGEVVSDLVHTPTYWLLRSSSGDSPRIFPLMLGEAEKQRRVLEAQTEAFTQEQRRWQTMDGYAVAIPDTNMFLKDDAPFDKVDWFQAVDSRLPVRIVIPLVVIHELDRLKRQGNNTARKLAQQSLRWLYENLPMGNPAGKAKLVSGFPSVTVEIYVQDIPARVEDADGIIIRFARQAEVLSGRSTKLVTRDLGMRLRANTLGVDAVQLPDW